MLKFQVPVKRTKIRLFFLSNIYLEAKENYYIKDFTVNILIKESVKYQFPTH